MCYSEYPQRYIEVLILNTPCICVNSKCCSHNPAYKHLQKNNHTWKHQHNRGLNKRPNQLILFFQKSNRMTCYTYITVKNQSGTATMLFKLIFNRCIIPIQLTIWPLRLYEYLKTQSFKNHNSEKVHFLSGHKTHRNKISQDKIILNEN